MKNSIFRGHSGPVKKISSTLYREKEIWDEDFSPYQVEKDFVAKVQRYFSKNTSHIATLTDLRHYGCDVNLLDFSRNLYVALFFACNGKFDEDGELVVINHYSEKIKRINNHESENKRSDSIFVIEPVPTSTSKNRVEAQDSVFVYAKSGTLPESFYDTYTIDKKLKEKILQYLNICHDIRPSTIYNDLQGFIANEENFTSATTEFYRALSAHENGNFNKALDHYDKALEINPLYAQAYNNRRVIKEGLSVTQGALENTINPQELILSTLKTITVEKYQKKSDRKKL